MTTDEKLNLIDQMGEEYVPFVAFAGGEPLVARDLWRVLERCAQRDIHVTLATNGTLLTPEICQRLKAAKLKYVEVSVDSLHAEEHDAFRGMKGAWAKTVQGIRNSVAAGIRTGMACCFTRHTADSVDDMVKGRLWPKSGTIPFLRPSPTVKTAAITAGFVTTATIAEGVGLAPSLTLGICRLETRAVFTIITSGRNCPKRMAPWKVGLGKRPQQSTQRLRPINWFSW